MDRIFKPFFAYLMFAFTIIPLYTQTNNNNEIQTSDIKLKEYLVQNGFGSFNFMNDNTYTYSQRVIGGSIEGKGKYSVNNGLLHLQTYVGDGNEKPIYNGYSDQMQIPGKYRVDLEKTDIYNKGALVNIADGKCYWSGAVAEAYIKVNYEGTDCIRYPWRNKGINNEYIVVLENMKLRSKPSTKSNLVTVYGYGGNAGDVGNLYCNRSIEFAGTVSTIRAKSLKKDTIDGISAPWYLIVAYGRSEGDEDGARWAWIFGGYVKEVKFSELTEYEERYKTTLEQSLINAGGTLNSSDNN